MNPNVEFHRVAVLDDYQGVALSMADWSALDGRATVTVFNDHLDETDAVVERLQPFDIVCVMRERTPLTRAIIERLSRLRLIASTAFRNASIDIKAAEERGIQVVHTGYTSAPTVEMTWALILGSARNLVAENASVRGGGWQQSVGDDLAGRTLGLLGLGNVGAAIARVGKAFGMNVTAWSQNLTDERAAEVGVTRVSKEDLFRQGDIVSIHLVLSGRTRGVVAAAELALMKRSARLVNISRGPIVIEADLIAALAEGRIAGAAIDVYGQEPLPPNHPFRTLPNVLATPHIGYVSRGLYQTFYRDTVANIVRWIDAQGRRLNPSCRGEYDGTAEHRVRGRDRLRGWLFLPETDPRRARASASGEPVIPAGTSWFWVPRIAGSRSSSPRCQRSTAASRACAGAARCRCCYRTDVRLG